MRKACLTSGRLRAKTLLTFSRHYGIALASRISWLKAAVASFDSTRQTCMKMEGLLRNELK